MNISKKKKSEKVKKIKFSTGLEALLVPLKETRTVTVLILVRAGSEYEKKEINSFSSFRR